MDLWLTATVSNCKRVVAYRFTHMPIEPFDCMDAIKASRSAKDMLAWSPVFEVDGEFKAALDAAVIARREAEGETVTPFGMVHASSVNAGYYDGVRIVVTR